jgi:cell wall-associated NlpC family hydrolase
MSIDVQTLIDNYREWAVAGVRFLHQGRSRFGADCLGLIAAGAAEVGSSVFLSHLPINYGRDPQAILMQKLESLTRRIELQPGALVTIKWPLAEFASHAAIFTGRSIIHSYQSNGKVVEHSYGKQWIARTDSIWAIPLVRYQ